MSEEAAPSTLGGWIGLALVAVAAAAVVAAFADGGTAAMKKGLFIAMPMTLAATVPALSSRQTIIGRVALAGVVALLALFGVGVVAMLAANLIPRGG